MNRPPSRSPEPGGGVGDRDRPDATIAAENTGSSGPLGPRLGADRIDWDAIERTIRDALGRMIPRVRERCPELRSRPGRTSGRFFPLFAYRDFECADRDDEPLVVGVNFEGGEDGESIRIVGDICAEETGRIYYEAPIRTVAPEQSVVLAASLEVADHLAARSDTIVAYFRGEARPTQ